MVSVIIPCRNEVHFIGQCLDSILKNDYPFPDLEILVIDGNRNSLLIFKGGGVFCRCGQQGGSQEQQGETGGKNCFSHIFLHRFK